MQSVVIRVKDSYGGEETYFYRGPLNVFALTDCSAYCDGVIEAKKWFHDELQITLTPLYVSCLNKKLNNEDLTPIASANAGETGFTCRNSNDCMPRIGDGHTLLHEQILYFTTVVRVFILSLSH